MTTNTARQPKGIPVGGQFAATAHSESGVNLAPARRPELEGWPENLPEPDVSFHFGHNNSITTNVSVNGESVFEVWNPEDEDDPIETTCFEMGWAEADVDAAESWAKQKHQQIADDLREEMSSAVNRARARVLAKTTGIRPQATTAELEDFRNWAADAAHQVTRELELSSAALAARGIIADHPDAASADIRVDSWDNGDFISGAVIKNEEGDVLHELVENDGEEPQGARDNLTIATLKALDANAEQSHWAAAFSTGGYGDELYTIDLHKAAAWAPGDEA